MKSWLSGRASVAPDLTLSIVPRSSTELSHKLRRAYRWIADSAVHTPYSDVSFGPPVTLGRGEQRVDIYESSSYSSFLLLPLLTLITSRRMVFIGGTGRGKTTVATIMGLLAGYELDDMRRAIQHGHPQLTIADLLGSPLPSELMRAEQTADIRVAWRRWITMRVKVIDEYNRIPTKTQSALLSLMAEGYAEMFEQVVTSGRSAWFLTANDDLGGGTFPVIEALRDRIDLAVRCTPFHPEYLDALARRIETAHTAEEFVPADIVFSADELTSIDADVRAVPVPEPVLDVLGFLLGQLDFCRRASDRLEYMNKDTLHLAGRRVGHVCTEDCPLDKQENLCTQSEGGASARAYLALIHYAKALAYFRGAPEVTLDDVRALMPWVFHDKLEANPQSPFFQKLENKVLVTDKVSWIRQLFDRAIDQHAAYRDVREPVREMSRELAEGLAGVSSLEARRRMAKIVDYMEQLVDRHELSAPVHQDLVLLKSIHDRYRDHIDAQ